MYADCRDCRFVLGDSIYKKFGKDVWEDVLEVVLCRICCKRGVRRKKSARPLGSYINAYKTKNAETLLSPSFECHRKNVARWLAWARNLVMTFFGNFQS